jgi:putative membrane protein
MKWTMLATLFIFLCWSAYRPYDGVTWMLEAFPVFIGFGILSLTYKKFKFTDLVYGLIFLHCLILLLGAHYSYAEVPFFNYLRDELELSRNYYDRVGHFMQGFVPAMIGRELIIRTSTLKSGKWLFTLVVLGCLGISSLYELFEWGIAEILHQSADAFLGAQGDIWDTQKDMFMALIGAVAALILFSKYHDKVITKIKGDS